MISTLWVGLLCAAGAAEIVVTLIDPSGVPVPDATVAVYDPRLGVEAAVSSVVPPDGRLEFGPEPTTPTTNGS